MIDIRTIDRRAIANRIATEYLPDTGPCAFCDSKIGARHRLADAIVDEVLGALEPAEPTERHFVINDPDDERFQELWALGVVSPVPLRWQEPA